MNAVSTVSPDEQVRRVLRLLEDSQRREFYGTVTVLVKKGAIVQVEVAETVLTQNLK
jgi:hypothetical protein